MSTLEEIYQKLESLTPKELSWLGKEARRVRRLKTGYKPKRPRPTRKPIEQYRDDLVTRATPAELRLKDLLEREGVKFLFQEIIGQKYVVDFVLLRDGGLRGLVVEVDGGYHLEPNQKRRDAKRERWLSSRYQVVRFSNEEVLEGDMIVMMKIRELVGLKSKKRRTGHACSQTRTQVSTARPRGGEPANDPVHREGVGPAGSLEVPHDPRRDNE